jgi:hypothetical protein
MKLCDVANGFTLLEMDVKLFFSSAVQNVEIASYSGIIGAIVTNTLDCSVSIIKLFFS